MLLAALIMGVAGSLHCAGMCSPLAMAITNSNTRALTNRILYNLGRISMYGVLGSVVATIGYILPLSKFQNALSILLGLALLVMAVTGVTGVNIPFFTTAVLKFTAMLKKVFARFIQHKTTGGLLMLGALNGLLPCGLTFLALSFCLTLSTPLQGFAYMFAFGVGTLPVMLGLTSVFGFITNRLHWNIKVVTTGLMLISGLLLIARIFLIHLPEGHQQHSNFIDIVICR
jgi:uncharacterized protein